jgi:hypothetical protein
MTSTLPDPDPTPPDRLFIAARFLSLFAALALVAQSEWALALAVGWPWWIAWGAPLALDSYVVASIRSGQDLGPSVMVSAVSVLASHGLYADQRVWVGGGPESGGRLVWQLAAVCSAVPLLVTWRIHKLRAPDRIARVGSPDDDQSGVAWWSGMWSRTRPDPTRPDPTPDPTPGLLPAMMFSTQDPTRPDPTPDPQVKGGLSGSSRVRRARRSDPTPDPEHVEAVRAAIRSGDLPDSPSRDRIRVYLGVGSGPARIIQRSLTA